MSRKTLKVISTKNLPKKAPWLFTLLMIMFYDRCETDFMRGVVSACAVVAWAAWLVITMSYKQQEIDIFENENN